MTDAFTAVVLAAGRSRRLGSPKALARLAGETLVVRVSREAAHAGAARIVVVAGTENDPALASAGYVAQLLAGELPRELVARITIAAGRPDADPLASLQAGLAHVPPAHGLLVWPVDHPFADAALVGALARAVTGRPELIALPVAGRRRGHPVLFGAAVIPELAHARLVGGAGDVVRREPARVVEVAAADARVCADVDTPADAARLGIEL